MGGTTIAAPAPAAVNPAAVFKELGTRFTLHEEVTKYLVETIGLVSLEEFHYLFTCDTDAGPMVIDKITADINKPLEAARLRRAWAAVRDAATSNEIKKAMDSTADDLDKMLSRSEMDNLEDLFWTRYKLRFAADMDPSDSLVSRLSREITRRVLTVHCPLKVRTVASQLRSERKTVPITATLQLVEAEAKEPDSTANVVNYLRGLHILLVAFSKAGSTPVAPAPDARESRGADTTLYVECPLDVMLRYHQRATTALAQIHPARQFEWLKSRDEAERAAWVERHRGSCLSLGNIVQTLYKEREAAWMPDATLVDAPARSSNWNGIPENAFPRGKKRGNEGKAKQQPKGQQKDRPAGASKVVNTTKDGRQICIKYNLGKCSEPCPEKRLHVCNASVKGGRACGLRGHTASVCRNRRAD